MTAVALPESSGVSVDGATSEVRASTVNGSVNAVSSGGPVQASTVNGSIHATRDASMVTRTST